MRIQYISPCQALSPRAWYVLPAQHILSCVCFIISISQTSKLRLRKVMAPVHREKLVELELKSKCSKDREGPSSGPHSGSSSRPPPASQAQLLSLVFKVLQRHLHASSHGPPAYTSLLGAHLRQPHPDVQAGGCPHRAWGLSLMCPWWWLHWDLMQPTRPGAGLR